MPMRTYQIESYVPEEGFYQGKDAQFWRAAFADCFVIDLQNNFEVIASCRGTHSLDVSMADAAALLHLFKGEKEFLILPSSHGTLMVYSAWPHLSFALAFLFDESLDEVQKAYQNTQRYAFSTLFDAAEGEKINQRLNLENKLCTLVRYMDRLFGTDKPSNVPAHILMIANLVGCRLHEASVLGMRVTLDEREAQKLGAYLCCTFMTMRRYNGKVSALPEIGENTARSTHVPQEYGMRIEQTVKERTKKPTPFDLPTADALASYTAHPAFAAYRIEESDGVVRLHVPLYQKAILSSINTHRVEKEIILVLFPIQ